MKYTLTLIIILILISCKSQKIIPEKNYYDDKFISLDLSFIDNVKILSLASKKESLIKEKETFLNQKINDKKYFENLNFSYENIDIYNSTNFYNNFLKSVIIERKKNVNVKNVYFINVNYSGDELHWLSAILIENFDGNIQLFNNNGVFKDFFNPDIIEFTDELMLNTPYSFQNQTKQHNGYFTIDKITATGPNKYEVSSITVIEMLNHQLEILKKFYMLN